jgi:hypothetical protein
MAENSTKTTKWLLDWRYPLTSIASGLYVLTRLQAKENHSHTISPLVRIPAQAGQRFQPKLDSNSKASWSLIPAQAGQPKVIT